MLKNKSNSVVVIERGARLVPLLFTLSVILAAVCVLLVAKVAESAMEPSIDEKTVTTQLKACSDLATSKMLYRGLLTYESGNIDLWDKKGFQMIYDADIKAGIDMSKAKVSIDGKKIDITLPQARIQDVSVDPDSVKIYDQKYSLLNWADRSDTSAAMSKAKQDARKAAESSDIVKHANQQAIKIVKQMFSVIDGNDGYEVNVSLNEQDNANNKDSSGNDSDSNDNRSQSDEKSDSSKAAQDSEK